MPSLRASRLRPTLEVLEDRAMPAVAANLLPGGVLRVNGTPGDDVINVRLVGRQLLVQSGDDTPRGFNVGQVSRIVVNAGGGNDYVNLNSRGMAGLPIMKPSELHGGPGNDTLIGSEANDRLFGEGDDDQLFGGPGQDHLDGGAGTDLLRGGGNLDDYHDVFDPNVWAVNQHPGVDAHAIAPNDVIQGFEGNCQLLASLAAVARTQPAALYNDITHVSGSSYTVAMFNSTRFQWVRVPLTFNGSWTDHDPQPADPREYWTILYWQAYRRVMAGQPTLSWSAASNALTVVTGFTTWSTWNTFANGQYRFEALGMSLQNLVRQHLNQGEFLVVDTPPAFRPGQNGVRFLQAFHSYTVLGIAANGDLTLRNPWGDPARAGGETFTIPWAEFVRSFLWLHVN